MKTRTVLLLLSSRRNLLGLAVSLYSSSLRHLRESFLCFLGFFFRFYFSKLWYISIYLDDVSWVMYLLFDANFLHFQVALRIGHIEFICSSYVFSIFDKLTSRERGSTIVHLIVNSKGFKGCF